MISKKILKALAYANAKSIAEAEAMRHIEETTGAKNVLLSLLARQVALLQIMSKDFDARAFVKDSGIVEDYLQAHVLNSASHQERSR